MALKPNKPGGKLARVRSFLRGFRLYRRLDPLPFTSAEIRARMADPVVKERVDNFLQRYAASQIFRIIFTGKSPQETQAIEERKQRLRAARRSGAISHDVFVEQIAKLIATGAIGEGIISAIDKQLAQHKKLLGRPFVEGLLGMPETERFVVEDMKRLAGLSFAGAKPIDMSPPFLGDIKNAVALLPELRNRLPKEEYEQFVDNLKKSRQDLNWSNITF